MDRWLGSVIAKTASTIEITPIAPEDAGHTLGLVLALEEYDAKLERRPAKVNNILGSVTKEDYARWIAGSDEGTLCGYKVVTDDDPYAGHVIFSEDPWRPFYSWSGFSDASKKAASYGIYLDELYLRPQIRGQQLGHALMAHVAQAAMNQEQGLWLQVMGPNQQARDLYASIGGREIKIPPTTYGVERFVVTFNDLAIASMCADIA